MHVFMSNRWYAVDGVIYLAGGKMVACVNDLSCWKVQVKESMKAIFNGVLQSEADNGIARFRYASLHDWLIHFYIL